MPTSARPSRMTSVQWLVCVIASIGFAFDIYELLMLPLIVRPALLELGGISPGTPEFGRWVGILFFAPAIFGGIFGLLGGYLTDRLGRRRVLTWSILLYAFSAFFAGFSTNLWMLLILRCTTFVGVCIEFVAAVAWLAELFSEPHRRERVLGYTQAFSSVGGLLVAVANGLAVTWALDLPAIQIPSFLEGVIGQVQNPHGAWRYTLMSGLIPAIPLIIIRPFLPESPAWKAKKDSGTLKRPSFAELFSPKLRRATIVSTIMFACSYGAAFGAIQHIPQMVPGLPQVKAVTSAVEAETDQLKEQKKRLIEQQVSSNYVKVQEVGGLVGRFLLALLVVRIASRRNLLRVFLIPGLVIMPFTFAYAAVKNPDLFVVPGLGWEINMLQVGIFLAGLITVAQFSFWGNYLPTIYPMHLRGTGESFAANIGGRLIGTSFAAITANLAVLDFVPGSSPAEKLAYTAASIGLFVYVMNLICTSFLPEPGEELAE